VGTGATALEPRPDLSTAHTQISKSYRLHATRVTESREIGAPALRGRLPPVRRPASQS
jgi:hypothetical protein